MAKKKTGRREQAWVVGRAGAEGTELIIGALKVRKDGTLIISDRLGVVLAAQAGQGAFARRSLPSAGGAAADGPAETAAEK